MTILKKHFFYSNRLLPNNKRLTRRDAFSSLGRRGMEKEYCQYCFEEVRNCVCHWNTCAECGKRIPDSHASEYRGRVWCEEHDFDEQVAKRDFERQEVMAETNHAVRSQVNGEWHNGGYKTMKTDPHSGRPITKIKEPARLKQYESR